MLADMSHGSHIRIPTALLVVAAPGVVYTIAFLYELGYTSYWKMPVGLVQIDLRGFFVAAGVLAALALLITSFAALLSYLPDWQHPAWQVSRKISPLILVVVFLTIVGFFNFWEAFGTLFVIAAALFLLPLWSQRGKGNYRAKLFAEFEAGKLVRAQDPLRRFLNPTEVVASIGLASVALLAFAAGEANARHQDVFLTIEGRPPSVVLRIYGETMISAPLDAEEKTLQPVFLVQDLSQGEVELQLERLGRLIASDP